MSKRCTKCGSFLTEADRFCPSCGENSPETIVTSTESNTSSYSQPQYNQSAFDQNQYSQQSAPPPYAPNSAPQYNPYPQQEEEMTVGKWLLTIFLTSLGIIGLVLLFVWGFGDGPKARQNYCKAMLIFWGISVVLSFILVIFYIGIFGAIIGEIVNSLDPEFYESGYEMAKSLIGFLK